MLARMPDRTLEQLLVEVDAALASDHLSDADRTLLERVRQDLAAAKHAPATPPVAAAQPSARAGSSQLRETLSSAIERLETQHPRLTSLLGKTLDALSDVGL
jgi:hypothetical protein